MSKIYFMNNGDFDIRAMMTMGVSAKEGDDAIGYFGTGFKYAVAIILRLGGSIKVSTVGGIYEFTSQAEVIRGKTFNVVYVNGDNAGFTTHLGVNWKPWMAFRELYCNAKDEGGVTSEIISADYDTVIEVSCHDIAQAYRDRHDYFITSDPIISSHEVDVHSKGRPFFFYKGVAVDNAPEGCKFSYNIKSTVDLTEDRTARYDHQIFWPIRRFWQNHCSDLAMLRSVVQQGDHGEKQIGFDPDWGSSDTFNRACDELLHTDIGLSESARKVYEKAMKKTGSWPKMDISPVQKKMFDKAVSRLAHIDVDISRYRVNFVTGLGDGVMGRAYEGEIYISEIPFGMGTKQLASTLLEEWVHLKTGAADFDRKMQNWLFDKILSLAESITGEPI